MTEFLCEKCKPQKTERYSQKPQETAPLQTRSSGAFNRTQNQNQSQPRSQLPNFIRSEHSVLLFTLRNRNSEFAFIAQLSWSFERKFSEGLREQLCMNGASCIIGAVKIFIIFETLITAISLN